MSRLIKVLPHNFIEISEYKSINGVFNTQEYSDFEEMCVYKEVIDPFKMYYENKQLKERIRILTEHPFISALNNDTAFNKKEISFIIRIDNGKAFKVEKELFDYVTDLERKNQALKTCIMTDHHKIHALVDVIDEAKEYINNSWTGGYTDATLKYKVEELNITELLEILDKAGDINEKKN